MVEVNINIDVLGKLYLCSWYCVVIFMYIVVLRVLSLGNFCVLYVFGMKVGVVIYVNSIVSVIGFWYWYYDIWYIIKIL